MNQRKTAFTLIELLVVIVIVCILAGIVLKLMTLAQTYQRKAATIAIIERVSFALSEYRAEYGQYPPVPSRVCRGFFGCHPADCRTCYSTAPGDGNSEGTTDTAEQYFKASPNTANTLYTFGLISYLMPRPSAHYFTNNLSYIQNQETERDQQVKYKWLPFLSGIVYGYDANRSNYYGRVYTNLSISAGAAKFNYSLPVYSIADAWDRTLRYRSEPPYSTYDLWSAGPDGADGEGIVNGIDTGDALKARDNVHFKHGKWDG